MRESAARASQDYGRPLDTVTYFKYFGRILTALDDNWPAVVGESTEGTEELSTPIENTGKGGSQYQGVRGVL